MQKNSKIYIAGHNGLVGSAIHRALSKQGYTNLLTRNHAELDLTDQAAVKKIFQTEKPEYVFLAAAKVGGILANDTYPAEFIYENLAMQNNVIHEAYKHKVKKLLFLGSSCVYPKNCPQPIKEEYLLTGPLEETNEAYAIAKIAGIIQCQSYDRQYGTNFISVMPTNTYGPNDNFDLEIAHMLPALIRKFHEAKLNNSKQVVVWGTGRPMREGMHVDDLADACLFLMNNYNRSEIINIGTGQDMSVKDIAGLIKDLTGYSGEIAWDTSKPDGMLKKQLDVSKIHALGWKHTFSLAEGLKGFYEWFKNHEI